MALYYLYPDSETFTSGSWALTGAATSWEALDDPQSTPDDATTYAQGSDAASAAKRLGLTSMTEAAVINSVTVKWRRKTDTGSNQGQEDRAGITLGGADYVPGFTATPTTFTTATTVLTTNPATGLAWSKADLDAAQLVIECRDAVAAINSIQFTQCFLEVDFVPNPVRIGAARDVGSRLLRLFRRPVAPINIEGPLAWGDVEIGDFFSFSHRGVPDTHSAIPGRKKWERRCLLVLGHTIDLARKKVILTGLDVRDYLTSDWDTMISEDAPATQAQGIARLNAGGLRSFTRASRKWVENAAVAAQGSKQVVELGPDVEPLDTNGELLEGAATNQQLHSSAVSGATGHTTAGTGSNGSAIATDTTIVLFDTTISAQSYKFTAGSPIHVADLERISSNAITVLNGETWVASFDHYDGASVFYYAIQRADTTNWWRDSDQTWQAAKTWNAMTLSNGAWHKHVSKLITMNANTTLTTRVGIPTATGVAGQINYWAHTQVERTRWASSRIVTTTAAVTRALDNLRAENNTGARSWNVARGTFFIQGMPLWNSADINSAHVIVDATFDANNFATLYYSGGTVAFQVRVAGSDFLATKSLALVRGTLYAFAARWVGADGEENLAPYTLSVFAGPVGSISKGTDAVASGLPTTTSPATFWIGQSSANTLHWDGWLRHRFISPFVYSDDEIADLP